MKEYSEGVKGIVDVVPTPDGRTFVITGKKPGTTTLLLIKTDGTQITFDISVANRNPQQVEREIQSLLEPFPGVKSRRVGSRIFVEGAVPTDQDYKRIQQIVTVYGGQVDSLVTVGVAERKLLIRLDFFFVQYSKTSGYNVGVGWPSNIGGTTAAGQPVVQSNVTYDFISRTTQTAQRVRREPAAPSPRHRGASRLGEGDEAVERHHGERQRGDVPERRRVELPRHRRRRCRARRA